MFDYLETIPSSYGYLSLKDSAKNESFELESFCFVFELNNISWETAFCEIYFYKSFLINEWLKNQKNEIINNTVLAQKSTQTIPSKIGQFYYYKHWIWRATPFLYKKFLMTPETLNLLLVVEEDRVFFQVPFFDRS